MYRNNSTEGHKERKKETNKQTHERTNEQTKWALSQQFGTCCLYRQLFHNHQRSYSLIFKHTWILRAFADTFQHLFPMIDLVIL